MRTWVGAVVAALLVLTGCGVDDGDVADLEALVGVTRASSSCTLGSCTLSVETASTITANDLEDVLSEARGVGASTTEITSDGATVEFRQQYDGSVDAQASRVVTAARDLTSLTSLRVDLAAGTANIGANIQRPRDAVWEAARSMWDDLEGVADRTVSVTNGAGDRNRSRITASDSFPQRSVDFVRGLATADLVNGVDIDGERVLLGVTSRSSIDNVEDDVATDVRAEGLDVEVVLATNILAYRDDAGGSQDQVRAMVSAMEAVTGVVVTVVGQTVEVSLTDGSLDEIADAIATVRRDTPDIGEEVPLTVQMGSGVSIELNTTGSPSLVGLASLVLERSDVSELTIKTRREVDEPPRPPSDTDASVQIQIASGDLSDSVEVVSRTFARWDTPVESISVFVTAVDPEGRQPSVPLRVDRRGEGPWVASSLDRGLPEVVDQGIRAWAAGAR